MDTAAALGRYTREQMIGFARRLDPGLTDRDFADAIRRLDQWGDGVFAPYGLGPAGRRGAARAFRGLAPLLILGQARGSRPE